MLGRLNLFISIRPRIRFALEIPTWSFPKEAGGSLVILRSLKGKRPAVILVLVMT